MPHHGLRLFDARARIQKQVVIGDAQTMKVELPARRVLGDTRVLEVDVKGPRRLRQHE